MEGRGVWNKALSFIFGMGFVTELVQTACVYGVVGGGRLFLECNASRNKINMTPSNQITLESTKILPKRYCNNVMPLGSGVLCNKRPQKHLSVDIT